MTLSNAFGVLVNWFTRRRSIGLAIFSGGLSVFLAQISGVRLATSIPFGDRVIDLVIGDATISPLNGYLIQGVALIFSSYGLWLLAQEHNQQSRKRVIVIEARGLRDVDCSPLIDCVPSRLRGSRDSVLMDFRQGLVDGEVVDPGVALNRLLGLSEELSRRVNSLDKRDVSIVYGGMAPVPLTFLTGVLVDDENTIEVMDWDRHSAKWRDLSAIDRGQRFCIDPMPDTGSMQDDVAVAISVSYSVDKRSIGALVGSIPMVELRIEQLSTDAHWSIETQRELGRQFLTTMIRLEELGVQQIHMFIAAPNSLVFRFGSLYDKRNLPCARVYQYQRNNMPTVYPWSIRMPTTGIGASIAYTSSDEISNR